MAFIRGIVGWLDRARAAAWPLACALLLLTCQHAAAVNLTGVTFTATTPTQTAQPLVYVRPNEALTANLSGNTNDSTANWRSTGWRLSTTSGGYSCANTTNFDTNNGSTTLSVPMTAPATAGLYNVYFQAYTSNTCTGATGSAVFATGVVQVDATVPTAVVSCSSPAACGTANPTKQATLQWTVVFSEVVTGVTTSNFTTVASGPTGTSVTGISANPDGMTYTVTASSGSGSGTVGLNMASSLTTIIDRAGNNPVAVNATAGNTYTIDKTAPTVTSIVCAAPASCGTANPTNAAQVSWTVTFSEAVTGVSTANFALVGSGTLVSVTGSGTTYTVTANTGADGTTIGLSLVIPSPPSSIVDALGTALTTGLAATAANTYTIDKAGPVISAAAIATTVSSNMPVPSALAKVGDTVTLTFTTSGASASVPPVVAIAGRAATVTAVSSPTTWSASQVMVSGDAEGVVAFTINVSDPLGNAATPRTTTTNGSSVTLDKTAPFVSTLSCSNPLACGAANPTTSTTVTWALVFNENVTGLAAGNFGFSGSAASPAPTADVQGSGANWTVAATASVDGTLGLNLSSLSPAILDGAGNALATFVTATAANTYTISRPPIATIACSSPTSCGTANPTGAASVTWAVTFSSSVTGLTLANFSLTGTSTGSALTSILGGGTSWFITATTGANGTLELNLNQNLSSIVNSGGQSPAAVIAVASNIYTKNDAISGECFTDDFNRASLGTNWSTSSSGGTVFQPVIVGNRMRLTDNTINESTAAHLQRIFPGSGNKVVVEFDYYSYGGTGADGMAVILSDGSISPVAGAFGGSLGYAQKAAPGVAGSDCAIASGCPGFTGGWLGIGLDEFGNFSAEREGRIGGDPALGVSGLATDSIGVRGSGSGLDGYRYHQRTATLSPGVDASGATPNPGHRYRITIDHQDGVHAYVSVERDATVNHTAYTTLIAPYDAKAQSGQAAVPQNWFLSYTGTTGSNMNIHEIDNLQVCTTRPMTVPALHHVRIEHDGAALTCSPETVTLRACADATCSALYLGAVTVDVASTGGTWTADPVTFSGGVTTVKLANTNPGSVTLSGTVTAPTATLAAAQCYSGGVAGSCTLPFSASSCAFDAVQAGALPGTPIYTKVAGIPFNIDVLALTAGAINTSFVGRVKPELVAQSGTLDANDCGQTVLATAVPVAGGTNDYIDMTAAGNAGRAAFVFNYPNAVAHAKIKVTSGATTACSNDGFAIRPAAYTVTSTDVTNATATGNPVLTAGLTQFQLSATPVNYSNATVSSGYTGTPKINNNRLSGHAGAVTAGVITGSFDPAAGSTTEGTGFTYSEVGNFRFQTYGVYDDGTFTAIDHDSSNTQCRTDGHLGNAPEPADPNVVDSFGRYGCFFGSAESALLGRFKPDHFDTVISLVDSVPMACPAGQICPTTYSGAVYAQQPFNLSVIAKRYGATAQATDGIVKNYSGAAFARETMLSAWNALGASGAGNANPPAAPAGSAIVTPLVPAASFVEGVATIADQKYALANPFVYTAPAANNWAAPTDVFFRATETAGDGISSLRAPAATSIEAGIKVLSGRFLVSHAYGSERLRLRVPVFAQYWNGSRWITNYVDSVSAFGSANVLRLSYLNRANAANPLNAANAIIVTQASAPLVKGAGQFYLQAPGANVSGSVDLLLNSPDWLPSTAGRARVGTYRSPLIYLREVY